MANAILIVGTGPAALLAADIISASSTIPVKIFERRAGPGWKLLVAGSSGLNVSYECPEEELASYYPKRQEEIAQCLKCYGRTEWLQHLHTLGEETFLGTSRRHFLVNKKASGLLAAWIKRLEDRNVEFIFGEELVDFSAKDGAVQLVFRSGRNERGCLALLALGGPSWENTPSSWPQAFLSKGIAFEPFAPANAGFELDLPQDFFISAEGKPIKGMTLTTGKGSRTGECMITKYGLEGTPVYSVGCPGTAVVDLKPDLSLLALTERLKAAPSRSRLKAAKISQGAELLFRALAPKEATGGDPEKLAKTLKNLALPLTRPRPLSESISARGGLSWDELSSSLELKKAKGIYCAGEMVDWDAPTGGFLIQASVSMAAAAAKAMLKNMEEC